MNIVGSNALVRLPKVDIDEWNKIFEINVTGTLRGIQTCAPLIRESGGGSIVNIGSVAGITGNFSAGYSSSKWALEGLSRSAAYVYADWGIRCNVIQPGFIETDLTASMSSNPLVKKMQSNAMNNTVLLRRSGKADEIAFTALFLARRVFLHHGHRHCGRWWLVFLSSLPHQRAFPPHAPTPGYQGQSRTLDGQFPQALPLAADECEDWRASAWCMSR